MRRSSSAGSNVLDEATAPSISSETADAPYIISNEAVGRVERSRAESRERLLAFIETVWERGRELYRDLPWRNTHDPYAIMLSEVMLQQTQVTRVMGRWEEWLDAFPTIEALAAAPLPPVLELWQGMGYNRRALNLKRCAEVVAAEHGGVLPSDKKQLLALPGIGPSTSAGIRAFAFELPDVYLETNVRAVFIHEFIENENVASQALAGNIGDQVRDKETLTKGVIDSDDTAREEHQLLLHDEGKAHRKISDKELIPLVKATCPQDASVRDWYYALLDYGAYLKKTRPNPTRKSKQYTRQSKFEGSHRQKRAYLLRRVLEAPFTSAELAADLAEAEAAAGREGPTVEEVQAILTELEREGFITSQGDTWLCAE